jgi:nucleoid DNA-binding protein
MKKSQLVKEITRQNGGDAVDAADQMDRAVDRIISILRGGKSARLPGIGTISPGKKWTFRPDRSPLGGPQQDRHDS